MFDRGGNYAQIIVGSESKVFGAKTFCAFGTYSVDEANEAPRHAHRIGCSVAKLAGTTPEPRHHAADGRRVEIFESGHVARSTS